ncbi:polysaccharide pyruvyl transferase family protein [Brachybacterium sp. NPDC056505]|uniref:polysaccharide pyruvyl transferase family protein n=1 Tax=Brachybacterium sp. NPDC056505 TaxID=3345843 RepID=UPI0036720872
MTDPKQTFDVAVCGWWYGKNYGSILTYYGLNRAIENLGHSVLMVHEPLGYNGFRVEWPDDIVSMQFAERVGYHTTQQMHFTELPRLNERARTFVVGSDQLWNPLIGRVNSDLFLDFVSEKNNRVAYGTSFGNRGTKKFTPDFIATHAAQLQRFKAISVREGYAVDTARDIFGAKASLVVDPVFLLPREHYDELAANATVAPEGEYLSVFFLDPTEEKKAVAQGIADKLGLEIIRVIPNPDDGIEHCRTLWADEPRAQILDEDRPENFLRTYKDAEYVVTDSFHGSAFAAIFEKPFSSIFNTKRGADRFKNLMSSLGFDETRRVRETDSHEDIAANPHVTREIDYSTARDYISSGRESSMAWLKDALDPSTTGSAALYPRQKLTLTAPDFATGGSGWKISRRGKQTRLRVARDGSVLGNLVWTDLPEPLVAGSAYQLRIDWTPTTDAKKVNIHVRNPETTRFRVVGAVNVEGARGQARTDTLTFTVSEPGFTQFMLGGVHFTGRRAGADIRSIEIERIPTGALAAQAPAKRKGGAPAGGFSSQAKALALKDSERQVRSFSHARSADGVSGAQARMIFHAHAIEKGLSRSNFRPGFGGRAVPGLSKEMNAWLAADRDISDEFLQSSAAVMKAYFDRHDQLGTDVSHFRQLFSEAAQDLIDGTTHSEGGVLPAGQVRELVGEVENEDEERSFLDVVYGRRSVREYTSEPVKDEEIARAVQIALQSPSVCNRQGARVHQFEDPDVIKKVLDIQGGFAGYEMPPRLLLVSADLDAFLFAPERNQPFVDGGLFMMSLLLGLTQVGLGSVPLNTAMGTEKETKIRELIDIPDHEVFISFIGVGHFDESVLVPRSKRTGVQRALVQHKDA